MRSPRGPTTPDPFHPVVNAGAATPKTWCCRCLPAASVRIDVRAGRLEATSAGTCNLVCCRRSGVPRSRRSHASTPATSCTASVSSSTPLRTRPTTPHPSRSTSSSARRFRRSHRAGHCRPARPLPPRSAGARPAIPPARIKGKLNLVRFFRRWSDFSGPVSILGTPVRRVSEGGHEMRLMVLVKADESSEKGVMPDEKLLSDMSKYNEEMVKAGVMLAGEGLHPSSKGVRIRLSGGKYTVTDGPFAEAKELVAGFWRSSQSRRKRRLRLKRNLSAARSRSVRSSSSRIFPWTPPSRPAGGGRTNSSGVTRRWRRIRRSSCAAARRCGSCAS